MEEALDLKKLRQRVAVTYMKDGLFEMYVGFMLAVIGLFEFSQHYGDGAGFDPIYSPAVIFFPMILFLIAKRRIIRPRVGYVDFSNDRYGVNKLHLVMVIVAAAVLFGLVYVLQVTQTVEGTVDAHKPYVGLYLGVFCAGVLSVMAVAGESPLTHIESAFFLLVFVVLFLFDLYIGIGLVVCGAGLLVAGGVMLTRFLRNNPLLPPDDYKATATGA